MAPKINQTGYLSSPWLDGMVSLEYVTESTGATSSASYLLSTKGATRRAQRFVFKDLVAEADNGFVSKLYLTGGAYDGYWLDLSSSGYPRPYKSSCLWRFFDRGEFWEWQHADSKKVVIVSNEPVKGVAREKSDSPASVYLRAVDTVPAATGCKNFSIA